jgi:hypothetical protein
MGETMTIFINKIFNVVLFITILFTFNKIFAQSGNNAFVFNGETSQLFVYDGSPANPGEAIQEGFKFFNSDATNNQITVQAWIYLLGDTPTDIEIPVVYRAVNGGTTFSLYIKNNRGHFSVRDSDPVLTPEFNAFQWIALTGTYDGSALKIYLNGDQVEPALSFQITPGYTLSSGSGLYIGKSNTGAFKGAIDEVRIFNIDLGTNHINNSGGNGNPAENFPSSIAQYLSGQWSFTEINPVDGLLHDLSNNKNHLLVNDVTQIIPSKPLPFFVVTSTSDDGDELAGDGKATSVNGDITLRSAIEETNALTGQQTIYFYIKDTAPVIQPSYALPPITQPVILDGTSQSGYTDSPIIQIEGPFGGLTISGGGSTVKGLDLDNSAGDGMTLSSAGEFHR